MSAFLLRMKRQILMLAVAMSLIFNGIAMLLWLRSYKIVDMILVPMGDGYAVGSGVGNVWVGRVSPALLGNAVTGRYYYRLAPNLVINPRRYLIQYRMGSGSLQVTVPYWIIIVGLLLASYWLVRRTLCGPGFCRNCGYDLRATPNRCPECGQCREERLRK